MTLTLTPGTVKNNLTNVVLATQSVTSQSPYLFVVYNLETRAIEGNPKHNVQYRAKGTTTRILGIIACDTYADLQEAVMSAGLTGTPSADPTPA